MGPRTSPFSRWAEETRAYCTVVHRLVSLAPILAVGTGQTTPCGAHARVAPRQLGRPSPQCLCNGANPLPCHHPPGHAMRPERPTKGILSPPDFRPPYWSSGVPYGCLQIEPGPEFCHPWSFYSAVPGSCCVLCARAPTVCQQVNNDRRSKHVIEAAKTRPDEVFPLLGVCLGR